MKHTFTYFIAPRIENEILCSIEGDKTKIFICEIQEITYQTSKIIDEQYFREGMKRSIKAYKDREEDFWIAGVKYMENFFKENENSILVVGNNIINSYEVVKNEK